MTNYNDLDMPKMSPEEVQRVMSAELSLRSRLIYTALLLLSLFAAAAIASLWLTEPSLPQRTHLSFAALVGIALSWAVWAGWTLTRRKVLLAGHRVIAARMAIAFSLLFAGGAAALGIWSGFGAAAFAAAGVGAGRTLAAAAIHWWAKRAFAALLARREELEAQVRGGATRGAGASGPRV